MAKNERERERTSYISVSLHTFNSKFARGSKIKNNPNSMMILISIFFLSTFLVVVIVVYLRTITIRECVYNCRIETILYILRVCYSSFQLSISVSLSLSQFVTKKVLQSSLCMQIIHFSFYEENMKYKNPSFMVIYNITIYYNNKLLPILSSSFVFFFLSFFSISSYIY